MEVTDQDGVAAAEVKYRIGGSGDFVSRPLQPVGGDLWEGHIAGQASGVTVEYRVTATDAEGNVSTFPSEKEGPRVFRILSMSGDPVLYVVQSGSGLVSVVDSGTGSEVARIPTGDIPHSIVITPDDALLFVANTGNPSQSARTLTVIETATHRTLADIDVGFGPLDLAVDGNGTRIFVTNSDSRSLSIVEVASMREIKRINLTTVVDGPFGVAVQSDGETVYVTDIDGDQVLVIDTASGSVTATIPVVASPRSLALSTDGRVLYVAGFEGGVGVVVRIGTVHQCGVVYGGATGRSTP